MLKRFGESKRVLRMPFLWRILPNLQLPSGHQVGDPCTAFATNIGQRQPKENAPKVGGPLGMMVSDLFYSRKEMARKEMARKAAPESRAPRTEQTTYVQCQKTAFLSILFCWRYTDRSGRTSMMTSHKGLNPDHRGKSLLTALVRRRMDP